MRFVDCGEYGMRVLNVYADEIAAAALIAPGERLQIPTGTRGLGRAIRTPRLVDHLFVMKEKGKTYIVKRSV